MSWGKLRLFGSETERIIGRMHEFTLYKPTWTEVSSVFGDRKAAWTSYPGLYGFIQPKFLMDERFEIKGISELGSLVAHFKQTYTTATGDVSVEVGDQVYWDEKMWKVATIIGHRDARGKGLIRASLDSVVE